MLSNKKSGQYLYLTPKVLGVLSAILCIVLKLNNFHQWYWVGIVAVVLFFLPELVLGHKENVVPPRDWYK